MRTFTATVASIALAATFTASAPASASWSKFWGSVSSGSCWKEAAEVAFTAGIKQSDNKC